MSMSSHIKGVRNLNGKFQKMMDIKLACEAAGSDYPKSVLEYFEYPGESEQFLKDEMSEVGLGDAVREYSRDCCDYFDVDLSKISDEVKIIRFVNSY